MKQSAHLPISGRQNTRLLSAYKGLKQSELDSSLIAQRGLLSAYKGLKHGDKKIDGLIIIGLLSAYKGLKRTPSGECVFMVAKFIKCL